MDRLWEQLKRVKGIRDRLLIRDDLVANRLKPPGLAPNNSVDYLLTHPQLRREVMNDFVRLLRSPGRTPVDSCAEQEQNVWVRLREAPIREKKFSIGNDVFPILHHPRVSLDYRRRQKRIPNGPSINTPAFKSRPSIRRRQISRYDFVKFQSVLFQDFHQ